MKKLSSLFLMLMLFAVTGWAATSTLTFTAKCNGSGTADDGAEWTVTSDGAESTFVADHGIHYGTGNATTGQVSYIQLTTSDISGTITQVKVNASTASGVSATASVTVGDDTFSYGEADHAVLTTTATNYTFTGSASGTITVLVAKPAIASKALYVKSIEVTYTPSGGDTPSVAPEGAFTFTPADGSTVNIGSTVAISFSGNPNGGIKYTLDGTDPDEDSADYSGPIALSGDAGDQVTVKAIAYNTNGTDFAATAVASATYTLQQPTGGTVTFVAGTDTGSGTGTGVESSITKEGVTIHFTSARNNDAPYRIYSGSTTTVSVGSDYRITEIVITRNGSYSPSLLSLAADQPGSYSTGETTGTWTGSAVSVAFSASGQFRADQIAVTYELYDPDQPVAPDAPVISGDESFVDQATVTITADDGLDIFYTTDGTEPTTGSTPYSAPFVITATTTVKAIAFDGQLSSDVASKTFTKVPSVATVAAFNALTNNDVVVFTGDLQVSKQYNSYLFAQDETGGILIYGNNSSLGYQLGDWIPSGFSGEKTTYRHYPEMQNASGLQPKSQNSELAATEITELTAANFAKYVVLKNKKVGEAGVTLRLDAFGSAPEYDATKNYDIYGVINTNDNDGNLALWVTELDEVVTPVTGVGQAVVTLTQNAQDNTKLDVAITCENAEGIVFTIDGNDPTDASDEFQEGYQIDLTQVPSPVTVKAMGYDAELNFGEIGSATFTLAPIEITFDPADGTQFSDEQLDVTVTVTGTIGDAVITYYENDSEVEPVDGVITINASATISVEVLDERAGGEIVEASATYTKVEVPTSGTITLVQSSFPEITNSYAVYYATVDGFGFTVNQGYKNTYSNEAVIQMNSTKGSGILFNTTAIPFITSVKVTACNNKAYKVYFGEEEEPSDNENVAETASEYTEQTFNAPAGCSYFKILVNGATYIKEVVISYENAPSPETETLAEALEGEEGDVALSEPLKVVRVADGLAYASNGEDWVTLSGLDDPAEGEYVKDVIGLIGDLNTLPFIYVESYAIDEDASFDVPITRYNNMGDMSDFVEPKLAQVLIVEGYVIDGCLRAYSNGTGHSLKLEGGDIFDEGAYVAAEVSIKKDAVNVAGAPRRMDDTGNIFGGYTGVVVGSDTPTAVDTVKAGQAVVSVRYFNVAGMESSKPFNGVNVVVTKLADGTVKTAKVVR